MTAVLREVTIDAQVVVRGERPAHGARRRGRLGGPARAAQLEQPQDAVHHEGEQCDEEDGLTHVTRVGRPANSRAATLRT